ncbi:hypothetical protein BKG70_00580 [Mycobacteroides chelonae]|uniref:hypothetical protein n=1 Tax=Mycobacteroides chelonae TaxID=1774 RepID=UPI0008A9FF4D|nr:hypothetical protein [Mycobacteroides chelonae]OHT91263.1 hypothetical protein BKG70_00580 [Mycobacteroides chelonae]
MSKLTELGKALLDGVTEGPWEPEAVQGNPGYTPFYGVRSTAEWMRRVVFAQSDWEGYGNGSSKADAEFIAASRQLVPELIAEVERLEAGLAEERESHMETSAILRRARNRLRDVDE